MRYMSSQERNINLVLKNKKIKENCISRIYSMKGVSRTDIEDCIHTLNHCDLNVYWRMSNLVRNAFMSILISSTTDHLSDNNVLVIKTVTLQVIRDLIWLAEDEKVKYFSVPTDSKTILQKIGYILPFYTIILSKDGLFTIRKTRPLTDEENIKRWRLSFEEDSRSYSLHFRFMCANYNYKDNLLYILDTSDNVVDKITVEQLIEYTKLGINIYKAFVLFDGTVCINP